MLPPVGLAILAPGAIPGCASGISIPRQIRHRPALAKPSPSNSDRGPTKIPGKKDEFLARVDFFTTIQSPCFSQPLYCI